MKDNKACLELFLILLVSFFLSHLGFSQVPINDECGNAISITCEELITGSIENATSSNIYNGCFGEDPDIWYQLEGNGLIHTLNHIQGDDLLIYVINFDCTEFNNGCHSQGVLSSSQDSLSFGTEVGQDYLINVTTCCQSFDFAFQLTCSETAPNDLCTNAQLLKCSETVVANMSNATFDSTRPPCEFADHKDLWYQISGDDMVHLFEYNYSDQGDIYFDIYEESCDYEDGQCPKKFRLNPSDSLFSMNALVGYDYAIRVYLDQPAQESAFSFDHSCKLPEPNDLCENALIVECGQQIIGNTLYADYSGDLTGCLNDYEKDLWYIIEGDDLMHIFSIDSTTAYEVALQFTTESCRDVYTDCFNIYLNKNYFIEEQSFFAKAGNTYLFRLSTVQDGTYFKLNHYCQVPESNDNCSSPLMLDCGNNITGSFLLSSPSQLNVCENIDANDLWYTISGDGLVHSIKHIPLDSIEFNNTSLQLYESDDCNFSNKCLAEFVFYNNEEHFFYTEPGKNYYLRAYSFLPNEFHIEHVCLPPIDNDFCETPQLIECGNPIIGTFHGATSLYTDNGCFHEENPDLWYVIKGDGMVHSLQTPPTLVSGYFLQLQIIQNSCSIDLNDCPKEFSISNSLQPANFLAELGTDYLIRVSGNCCGSNINFEIDHLCAEPIENDLCSSAVELICDQTIEGNLDFLTHTGDDNGCTSENANDLWFTIEGNDLINLFYSTDQLFIEIYQGDCVQRNLDCVSNHFFDQNQEWFTFPSDVGTTYLARIWSYEDTTTNFTLEYTCSLPSLNNQCNDALQITCGESLIGNTGLAVPSEVNTACQNNDFPDLWYQLIGDGNLHIFEFVDNEETFINLILQVYENNCMGVASANEDCPSTYYLYFNQPIELTLEEGVSYFFRVTESYRNQDVLEFEVTHTCIDLLPNDKCSNPTILTCVDTHISGNTEQATFEDIYNGCHTEYDNDLWYMIRGDGQIHSISYDTSEFQSLFVGRYIEACGQNYNSCFPTTHLYTNQQISFLAEPGINYYFRIYFNGYQEEGSFSLHHNCTTPAANDNCNTPELITCDQDIIGNTSMATSSDIYNGCTYETTKDLWYQITGDDMLHELSLISSQSNELMQIDIYEEPCSDQVYLLCPNSIPYQPGAGSYRFYAEKQTNYYLRIYFFDHAYSGPFEIQHDCLEPLDNDSCSNAQQVTCGDRIVIDASASTHSLQTPVCQTSGQFFGQFPDIWYSVVGNGMIYQLEYLLSSSDDIQVSIYDVGCDDISGQCLLQYNLDPNNSNSAFPKNSTGNFFAEEGKEYLIQLHGYTFNPQKFAFKLNCFEPSAHNDCSSPIHVPCGENITGDLNTAIHKEGTCDDKLKPELWYTIQGDNLIHAFNLVYGEFPYLSVSISESDCAIPDFECINQFIYLNNNPLIQFFESDKWYLIGISGCCSKDGYFEIEHSCREQLANDNCENASQLSCDQIIAGNTEIASAAFINNGCQNENEQDLWYTITGDNLFHQFEYLSSTNKQNINLFIYGGTCGNFESCSLNSLLGDNLNPFSFFAESGKTYMVQLSYCCNRSGEFAINYKCLQQASNDDCIDATTLMCGDSLNISLNISTESEVDNACYTPSANDIWYSFSGDSLWHSFEYLPYNNFLNGTLEIELYEGDCNNLSCFDFYNLYDEYNKVIFFTQKNKDYLIRFHAYNSIEEYDVIFNCYESPTNDDCRDATIIECGDSYTGSLLAATGDNDHQVCLNHFESSPGVWFEFEGNGELIEITVEDNQSSNFELYVFEENCENDNCLSHEGKFQSQVGINYFIVVRSNSINQFQLHVNCIILENNDLCENAHLISCGDTILTSTTNASLTSQFNGCLFENENDVWYSLEGDGNFAIIKFLSSETGVIGIDVFEWNCVDENICITSAEVNSNATSMSFPTEFSKTYKIRMSAGCCSTGEIGISIDCAPIQSNDDCDRAISISCDEDISGNLLSATISDVNDGCLNVRNHDLWYTIAGDDMIHNFKADPLIINNGLYIEIYESSCPDTYKICDDGFSLGMDKNKMNLFLELGKSYYLRVLGSDAEDNFVLYHSCTIPVSNNNCDTARSVSCGDTLAIDASQSTKMEFSNSCQSHTLADQWFSIVGDGAFKQFTSKSKGIYGIQISVYMPNCELGLDRCIHDLYIAENTPSTAFYAEPGVEYLIQVGLFCCDVNDLTAIIEIGCSPAQVNDQCDSPILLNCGDPIQTNTLFSTSSANYNGCFVENNNDVWYLIEGDDLHHIFKIDSINYQGAQIYIYNQECTNRFVGCPIDLNFSIETSFYAELGTNYLLQVIPSNDRNNGYVAFSHECATPEENNNCEFAQAIICNETFNVNFLTASFSGACSSCDNLENSDLWYSIIGNGELHRFYSEKEFPQVHIELYQGSCDEFYECYDTKYLFDERSVSFYLEDGIEYLIRFISATIPRNLVFEHSCHELPINSTCHESTIIECGDIVSSNTYTNEQNNLPECFSYTSGSNGLWYSLKGNNSYVTIQITRADFFPILNLISNDCEIGHCKSIDRYVDYEELTISYYFRAIQDTIYHFYISGGQSFNNGLVEFNIHCEDLPTNISCSNPVTLSCDQTIDGNLLSVPKLNIENECGLTTNGPGLWYSVQSTGGDIEFELSNLNFQPVINIFDTNCELDHCSDLIENAEQQVLSYSNCQGTDLLSVSIPCIESKSDTIDIPIRLSNYENLRYLDFYVQYDSDIISYITHQQEMNGDLSVETSISDSLIYINWVRNPDLDTVSTENLDTILTIRFIKNNTSDRSYIPLYFTASFDASNLFGSAYRQICFDPGIIHFENSQVSCHEPLIFTIPAVIGDQYHLLISGKNAYDDGQFTMEMNCHVEAEIPTLSDWALIILNLLLLIVSVTALKQPSFMNDSELLVAENE